MQCTLGRSRLNAKWTGGTLVRSPGRSQAGCRRYENDNPVEMPCPAGFTYDDVIQGVLRVVCVFARRELGYARSVWSGSHSVR